MFYKLFKVWLSWKNAFTQASVSVEQSHSHTDIKVSRAKYETHNQYSQVEQSATSETLE